MADFFVKLQDWEKQVNTIQEDYKRQIEAYQADSEVYKSEVIAYQTELARWQVGQGSAVSPAEFTVNKFYTDLGWTAVDKEDTASYLGNVTRAWLVQLFIIVVLFGAILFLQKRKDVV